jgi:hypothetical protein
MIRDRVSMFCGGLAALVFALLLVFAGTRLLFVVSALAAVDPGLRNDLNVARLAAAGLGVALGLILYALAVARRGRHINRTGRLGMACAGLLMVLAGALLFTAFDGAASDLAELDEMHHLIAGREQLAGEVSQIGHDHSLGAASGFALLLGAMLVLSLSLWALFWSHVSPLEKDRLSRPTALAGAAGALVWASLLGAATFAATAVIDAGPPVGNPAFDEALRQVRLTLLLARGAAVGLILCGVAVLIFGVAFRVHRNT